MVIYKCYKNNSIKKAKVFLYLIIGRDISLYGKMSLVNK